MQGDIKTYGIKNKAQEVFLALLLCSVFLFQSCEIEESNSALESDSRELPPATRYVETEKDSEALGTSDSDESSTDDGKEGTKKDGENNSEDTSEALEATTETTTCTTFEMLPSEQVVKNPDWKGYTDYIKINDYEFLYSDERNLNWEKAIVKLANNYLSPVNGHPYLSERKARVYNYRGIYDSEEVSYRNVCDAEKKQRVALGINELIKNLYRMSDNKILYEVSAVIASINDSHTSFYRPYASTYNLRFVPLEKDGELGIYCRLASVKNDRAVKAKLIAISGVPVSEVVERLKPYVVYANDTQLLYRLFNGYGRVLEWHLLEAAGIIEEGKDKAIFTFEDDKGVFDIEVDRITFEEDHEIHENKEFVNVFSNRDYYLARYNQEKEAYDALWYEYFPHKNTMYIKINHFDREQKFHEDFLHFFEVMKELGTIEKLIVDLRRCPGGKTWKNEFIKGVLEADVVSVYVLTDGDSYSNSLVTADLIRRNSDHATLIGVPTWWVNGITYYRKEDLMFNEFITLPEYGKVKYLVPSVVYEAVDGDKPFVPDVEMHWNYYDYFNCEDTVLKYINQQ